MKNTVVCSRRGVRILIFAGPYIYKSYHFRTQSWKWFLPDLCLCNAFKHRLFLLRQLSVPLSLSLEVCVAHPAHRSFSLSPFPSFSASVQHCMLCEKGLIQANSRTLLSVIVKVTHKDTSLCVDAWCGSMSFLCKWHFSPVQYHSMFHLTLS